MAARIYSADRSIAVDRMRERAARAASGYEALGVGLGDTVALFLRNDLVYLEATLGAGMLGAYVVPVNWHNSAEEANYILTDSGAKVLVIHADLLAGIADSVPSGVHVLVVETPPEIVAAFNLEERAARVPAGSDDWNVWIEGFEPMADRAITSPGSMIYTSGTTGRPKGVRRAPSTPEQIQAGIEVSRILFGLEGWEERPEDVVLLIPGPLYHSAPNGWLLRFAALGANIVIAPRFDAEGLLAEIQRRRVTHLLAVPTMFVRLLKLSPEVRSKYDLSSLKFVMHGAAPCPAHVKREMIDWWGPVICEHYGNTETGGLTFCDSQMWLSHPGTVGKVLPGCELRIIDENGNDVPTGQPGEIVAWRKAYADFTYHGDDEKRRRAEKRPGLISLGDMGYLDQEGFVYLSGRSSDMVISGGVNIYPAEIEAELHKMPGVFDCAVFGIPDEDFGEKLCAYVQPERGTELTVEAVQAFIRDRMAGYKTPRVVEFVNELPREDSGKIFKRKLREPYWAGLGRQI